MREDVQVMNHLYYRYFKAHVSPQNINCMFQPYSETPNVHCNHVET